LIPEKQFMVENQSRRDAEIHRLEALRAKRPPFDDFPGNGVVLSDGIEFYCGSLT